MASDNTFDELERVGDYTCKWCGAPLEECSTCEHGYCRTCWPEACPRATWEPVHAGDDAERRRRWLALEAMRRHAEERARLRLAGAAEELPGNPARCPLCGSSSPCDCPF